MIRWKKVRPSSETLFATGMDRLLKPFALYAVVFVVSVLTSYKVPESARPSSRPDRADDLAPGLRVGAG